MKYKSEQMQIVIGYHQLDYPIILKWFASALIGRSKDSIFCTVKAL
jgi:hypothetical protein